MAGSGASEIRWNATAVAWAAGLLLGLGVTAAAGALVPGLDLATPDGGPGLLVLPLAIFLLPLEGMALATFLAWASLHGLRLERRPPVPPELRAGSGFDLDAGFRNVSRWAPVFLARLRVRIDSEGAADSAPRVLAWIAPGRRTDAAWTVVLRRRGAARVVRLEAEAGLPGSLLRRRRVFELGETVEVLPLLYRLSPDVLQLTVGRRQSSSSRLHLVPAGAEDFVGVRPYRPGDNPRFVNFPLSVRLPDFPFELAVREFEDPGQEDVCVVLDPVVPDFGPDAIEFRRRYEMGVSFLASLARRFVERKHRVRVVTRCGRRGTVDVVAGVRRDDLGGLDRELATLRPADDPEAFHASWRSALQGARAPVVFVSLREHAPILPSGRAAIVVTPGALRGFVEGVDGGD